MLTTLPEKTIEKIDNEIFKKNQSYKIVKKKQIELVCKCNLAINGKHKENCIYNLV
ncbi:MAG: hypothetical protein KatS3mg129_0276 [Leptospiraceae bacterium]|nr:MAG: hypothetical protein KatS3mg129_0276 [Leptospiraceae bacterium]